MPTLALTVLHRSMLAEIGIDGQVAYSPIDDEFTVGGALASADCDTAIRELVKVRLATAGSSGAATVGPVVLTDAGRQATR